MARMISMVFALLVLLLAFSAVCLARENPQGAHGVEKVVAEEEEEEEVVMPEGLCGYQSKTFSGQCVKRSSCAYQCQVVEHAAAGACHFHHVQRHCYCYVYC